MLLVELFYHNWQRYPSYKEGTKSPMSPSALHMMIQKFQITGKLGILPGRRQKIKPSSSFENMAASVM